MAALSTSAAAIAPFVWRDFDGGGSRFRNDDTLFARITPCAENGKVGLVRGLPVNGWGSTEFIVLAARAQLTEPDFVYRLARDEKVRSYALGRMEGTSGRRRVPTRVFDEIVVGVPPLAEQRRIAEILQAADDAVATAEAVIDQTEKVKRGLVEELLTRGMPGRHSRFKMTEIGELPESWEVVPMAALCSLITKGATPPKSNFGARFLRVQNLTHKGEMDLSSLQWVSIDAHNRELARSRILSGDVLMNIVGPPLGKTAFAEQVLEPTNINQAIALFRPIERGHARYIHLILMHRASQAWLQSRAKQTSGQLNLTLELCRDLPVPLPGATEVAEIVLAADALGAAGRVNVESATSARVVRDALQSNLLTGRVRT